MERRLRLFQEGHITQLWEEALAPLRSVPTAKPMRTRHQARLEEEGEMPTAQIGKIQALVEEGALSKAAKLLLSQELADSRDPAVGRA